MTPTKEQLIYLREVKKMTRDEIADHFGVNLPTVRRWIKDMKIPRPSKSSKYTDPKNITKTGAIIATPENGITLMEQAQLILGARLKERRGVGYILDGKHASTRAVVTAAGLKFKDEK